MNYVQITDKDRERMLATVGVESVDALYDHLPEDCRLDRPVDLVGLERGCSEPELRGRLDGLAGANRAAATGRSCFLGGGAYDHFIPAVVDAMAGQGAFVTAYTPYQAEASQGSLQAFFEFQTQVSQLTGMDVANASLYEGPTAVAEAVMMAMNVTRKRRVLIAQTLHPHYRGVIDTYLDSLGAEVVELPAEGGRISAAVVREHLDGDTACVVVQSPNVFGVIEDWADQFDAVHEESKALTIAVFNPIACGLLNTPGACGADIAAGEGQPLGIPMQYGGPYLGLFAAKKALMRKMPGRLVGQTTDADGRRAFCLTLQTREQHIRGEKATSNVCTNQGLMAMRATIYMSAVGSAGLRETAEQCYHKAHYAAEQISGLAGYGLSYSGEFFHEFVVDCPVPARELIDAGRERAILPGLDCAKLGIGGENQLLVAVTERRTAEQIDGLVQLLKDHS